MNDYQTRKMAEYNDLSAEVSAIAEHLNGAVMPSDLDDGEIPWFIRVSLKDSPLCLYIRKGHDRKLEISLSDWPSYTDKDGRKQTVYPSRFNLVSPETRAASGRDPKAIANQIRRKVIEPAMPVWERLQSAANDYHAYATKTKDGFLRLAESLGSDTSRYLDGHGAYLYVRNIPGDSFRVEYRSPGDVLLSGLPVDDVIIMLDALRDHRAKVELTEGTKP